MSDKDTPAGQHDEDDLLADFRDVADDDAGDASRQPDDLNTDLDALDAFLNEFGQGETAVQGENEPADLAAAADEMAEPEEPGADTTEPADAADPLLEEVALAAADPALDLSAVEEVPELSADVDPDDLDLGGMEDMAPPEPPQRAPAAGRSGDLFAASPAAVPAAAPAPVSIMADEDEAAMDTNKTLDISTIGVALVSLVIAAVAGWFAVSLHGQMNDLRAELALLRQQPAGAIAGPDRQTQENLALLTQRVNEMAVLLDGPLGHLSDSGAQINSMNLRLDELEQRLKALGDEVARAARTAEAAGKAAAKSAAPTAQPTAKAATKPTATVPQPAAKTTAAAKPAAAAGQPTGGWVVNVASLTDAKAAETERQRMQQAGFNVEVQTAQMDGRTWYRVRATGFSSREQAQVYSDMIRHKMGVTPWVGLDK
ncbi:SPOR domain-containing protein [Sulfurivermis fontis]|uniref:SPOR domain-containing protein n=1 Tax=Sulfurivermis fontis TaxID=1972068 RepID=UPI000FD78AE6|nr:SPOR domain-containing protein [Sulfurivermis fontis]